MTPEVCPAHEKLSRLFSSDALVGPPPGRDVDELIALLFTAEEAELAVHLPPFRQKPAAEIARVAGKPLPETASLLEAMTERKVIHQGARGYCLVPLIPGVFEKLLMNGDDSELHREFARRMDALLDTGYMKDHIGSATQTVRTIPVEQTIDPTSRALARAQIDAMIDAHEELALLTTCQCRQAAKLSGSPCKKAGAHEGCLAFGKVARFFVDQGGARYVSRGEMRRVVKRRTEKKLIFFTGNVSAENPNLICTCCDCCCQMLHAIIRPDPSLLVAPPPYLVEVDPRLCDDCGRCVTACNTEAHTLAATRHGFDQSKCVGCGLCVNTCPEQAIRPVPNPAHRAPSKSFTPLAVRLATAKLTSVIKGKVKRSQRMKSLRHRFSARLPRAPRAEKLTKSPQKLSPLRGKQPW